MRRSGVPIRTARPLTQPGTVVSTRPDRRTPPTWRLEIPGALGIPALVRVIAWTKSEARACAKAFLGLGRLPIGTVGVNES